MGATGDGGHFDAFADLLADEFTVVSYDRRGNGRSPVRPAGQTTSPEEQADDAAALLEALETGPAAVFGTSSGGNFALCLLVRHPAWVRGAILHEPGLYALVDEFAAVRAPLRALVQEAMERGGPPAAVERFWCYVAGDDGWNRLTPALRERLRATAGTLFEVELGSYELYLPDEETLAALSAPVSLLVGEDGLPFRPRSRAGSASAWAWRSPPRRARTRRITTTRTSLRRLSAHSCGRSPHERRRCGTVTAASMRDARAVPPAEARIPAPASARALRQAQRLALRTGPLLPGMTGSASVARLLTTPPPVPRTANPTGPVGYLAPHAGVTAASRRDGTRLSRRGPREPRVGGLGLPPARGYGSHRGPAD